MAEATAPESRRAEFAHVQTRTDSSGLAAPNLRMFPASHPPYQYIPQQPVRVALPAELMDVPKRMNVLRHELNNLTSQVASLQRQRPEPKPADDVLNHRLKDLELKLEASGKKRCEKLQNETQVAASQWIDYFDKRMQRIEENLERQIGNLKKQVQQFDKPDEQMQRIENLERQIGNLESQVQQFDKPDEQMQRFENLEKQIGNLEKQAQQFDKPDEQMQRFENLEKRIGNLEKQVQQFDKPDEQIQRFESLKKLVQQSEYLDEQLQRLGQGCEHSHNETRLAIEDVRVSLTAIMKQLDGIEEKAAGDRQQFEGLQEKVITLTMVFSDFIHDQPSTGEKRRGDLILSTRPKRSLRSRQLKK